MLTRLLTIVSALLLTACASPGRYQEHAAANAQFEKLVRAENWLDLEPVTPGNSPEAVRRAEIERLLPTLQPCFDTAVGEFETLGKQAEAGMTRQAVIESSKAIDARMNACTVRSGVTSALLFKVEQEFIGVPAYLDMLFHAAEVVRVTGSIVAAEEKANSMAMAYGLAIRPLGTSLVNVRPHLRSDGSFVPGHIRTAPDGVCVNNLGGCR